MLLYSVKMCNLLFYAMNVIRFSVLYMVWFVLFFSWLCDSVLHLTIFYLILLLIAQLRQIAQFSIIFSVEIKERHFTKVYACSKLCGDT